MNKSKVNKRATKKGTKKAKNTTKKQQKIQQMRKTGGIATGLEVIILPLLKGADYPVTGITGSNIQVTMMNLFVYLLSISLLKRDFVKETLNVLSLPKMVQLKEEKEANSKIYRNIAGMDNKIRASLIAKIKNQDLYKDLFNQCQNVNQDTRQKETLRLFHQEMNTKSSNPFGFKSDYDVYFEDGKFTCCFKPNKLSSVQSIFPNELFDSIMNPSKSLYITDLMNIVYNNYNKNKEVYQNIVILMKKKLQWNKRLTHVPLLPLLPGMGVGFEDFKLYAMIEDQYRSKDNVTSIIGNKVFLDESTTAIRKVSSLSLFNKQLDMIKYLYKNGFIDDNSEGDKITDKKLSDLEKKKLESEETIKEILDLLNKNVLDLYAEGTSKESTLSDNKKNIKFSVYQLMTIIDL